MRKKRVVHLKGKVGRIIHLSDIRGGCNIRMASVIKRYVMYWIGGPWYSDAFNLAHMARREAIMTLHAHHHGDRRDVAKNKDEERSQSEELCTQRVISVNTYRQMQEFLGDKPKEGVHVVGLLGTWDDAKAENILQFEADVRGKVVVVHDEGPRGLRTVSKGGKAIRRKAEGNVSWVFEEAVGKLTSIDHDLLPQALVVFQIVHVLDCVQVEIIVLATMFHEFCHLGICQIRLETGDDREIDE